MKTTLITLSLAVLTLTGCATKPATPHRCVLLKFPHAPSSALVAELAATQPGTTPAEVAAWFQSGETGFIIAGSHTNEIAAAEAEGATATIVHRASHNIYDFGGFKEKM